MDVRPSLVRYRLVFIVAALATLCAVLAFRGTPPLTDAEVIAINEGR